MHLVGYFYESCREISRVFVDSRDIAQGASDREHNADALPPSPTVRVGFMTHRITIVHTVALCVLICQSSIYRLHTLYGHPPEGQWVY